MARCQDANWPYGVFVTGAVRHARGFRCVAVGQAVAKGRWLALHGYRWLLLPRRNYHQLGQAVLDCDHCVALPPQPGGVHRVMEALPDVAPSPAGAPRGRCMARAPLGCAFYLTTRCQHRCAHCWLECQPDQGADMDPAMFSEIVQRAAAQGLLRVVALTGGEPFIACVGPAIAATPCTTIRIAWNPLSMAYSRTW